MEKAVQGSNETSRPSRKLASAATVLAAFCLASVVFTPAVRGQTTTALTLDPWPADVLGETNDHFVYQNRGRVDDGSGKTQVFWWDSIGRFRVDRSDPNSLSLGIRQLTIDFDTHSPELPHNLNDLSAALGVHLGSIGGGTATAVFGAGYTGNNLFADSNGVFGIGHLTWQAPLSKSDSWALSLDYDGSSAFLPDIPLPGFAYIHDDGWARFTVGFPRSEIEWRNIIPDLNLVATYDVPYALNVDLAYRVDGNFSVFGNFANVFQGFAQAYRDDNERTFYQMRRVEFGIRYTNPDVYHGIFLDVSLAAGYAFDQQFSRGFDVRDLAPFATISDEPYIGLILRGRF